ncbi:LOW QUALITY PROTEIN: protein O-mannosyl-transferase TMTC2-like [Uloborus diversus]|uniref:LOW QUALITY PROTEIN: protein O-mannosyl-transferase TMTC2-like n=1 Tax=Uloborus diversus TaxID=327109 RepID=UPI0024091E5B|nr:LOW QUALITY PROTEIN: protein O-mannosyl-transferase TMTC2-like [Uloborus diversus]
MRCEWLGVPVLALLLYWNTLDADFAYDDSRAIKTNQDLLPSTPLSRLFTDDFWGTPLTHSGSHKSYRPLCVLSFRLNYLLSGLEPGPYHLVNVVLHALVSALFALLARALLVRSPLSAFSAALLFAAHPVHTEAVAGVVGRADLGACLFFLLGLLAYRRYCKYRDKRRYLWASVAMATASMLTKEHGVTVLAVCALYDVCVVHRLHPKDFLQVISEKSYGPLREGLLHLLGAAVALLALRFHLMGSQAPNFSPADNPASDSDSLMTRTLTFLFLPAFNFWLLLCPRWLSFDWSMEAIPLLTSPMDPRNIFSACFYLSGVKFLFHISRTLTKPCAYSGSAGHCNHRLAGKQACSCYSYRSKQSVRTNSGSKNSVFGKYTTCCSKNFTSSGKCISNGVNNNNNNNCGYANGHHRTGIANGTVANGGTHSFQAVTDCQCHAAVIMAIGLLVIPFIPATNLFFYVGFVVAERVLYIPSMGFCLLVALGFEQLYKRQEGLLRRRILFGLFLGIIVAMSVRTVRRNRDWLHEENLYRSGIPINPPKGKKYKSYV